MKNCSVFLGLIFLTGCANLHWFDELKSGDRDSVSIRTYNGAESFAYDAPTSVTNYDRIDNAMFLNLQKPRAKGDSTLATAGSDPVIRVYKEGLHWTDNKGGYYTRQGDQLKDNHGVFYRENDSVWVPVK